MMSPTYLALLRGINLGPKNTIPMPDLAKMFIKVGCSNVRTYIQSGNVVFDATPEVAAQLADLIKEQIRTRFGHKVPVILRTVEQMGAVVRKNPFIKEGAAEDTLHVLFLADLPDLGSVENPDPNRSPPDTFIVRGQEVYLLFPNGVARTKLSNQYFDSKLGTIGTMRNWRTVTKLLELMDGKDLTPRPAHNASARADAGGRQDAK
jgi:uncharacterized protein (DUF1697 family)